MERTFFSRLLMYLFAGQSVYHTQADSRIEIRLFLFVAETLSYFLKNRIHNRTALQTAPPKVSMKPLDIGVIDCQT